MRRHRKTELTHIASGHVWNTIEPRRGMWLNMYTTRKEVGCGMRVFLIITVSKRNVTVYYVPTLKAIRLSMKDWRNIRAIKVIDIAPDRGIDAIQQRRALYERLSMEYSTTAANKAEGVINASRSKATSRLVAA